MPPSTELIAFLLQMLLSQSPQALQVDVLQVELLTMLKRADGAVSPFMCFEMH